MIARIEPAGHISKLEKPAVFNAVVANLFDVVEQGGAPPWAGRER
jgi:hypothetical protein